MTASGGAISFASRVVQEVTQRPRQWPEAKSVAFAGGSEFKMALPASSLTIIRAKR